MESIPRFIACKHDPSRVTYKHPSLEPILSVTYGCIVYQEQVMQIFQQLAGYSLGQADMVRRAMSKKKRKEIERERTSFIHGDPDRGIAGCVANGIPEATAEAIYQEIYAFAKYAFNKAHAVSYAVVAYQTAWFKCHYTREYMAALLTSVLDNSDKVAGYISECRDCGIALLPPDINRSADRLHRGGGGHPLRPGGHQEHRPGLHPGGDAGPGGEGPLHVPLRLLRPDGGQRHQQAGGGEPDPLRRL